MGGATHRWEEQGRGGEMGGTGHVSGEGQLGSVRQVGGANILDKGGALGQDKWAGQGKRMLEVGGAGQAYRCRTWIWAVHTDRGCTSKGSITTVQSKGKWVGQYKSTCGQWQG